MIFKKISVFLRKIKKKISGLKKKCIFMPTLYVFLSWGEYSFSTIIRKRNFLDKEFPYLSTWVAEARKHCNQLLIEAAFAGKSNTLRQFLLTRQRCARYCNKCYVKLDRASALKNGKIYSINTSCCLKCATGLTQFSQTDC